MNASSFQDKARDILAQGESLLIVAPTGIGKTFAVTEDLQDQFIKTVYAVPLRALGGSIKESICSLHRNGENINVVIHHGTTQESMLFSEEVIVTTYDQVVCATSGLPLSLPLKAGHAVAGAMLMSRLVLDEAHMAWGISKHALSILFGILDFRRRLNLQTIILTATLPKEIAERIAGQFELKCIILDESYKDERFMARENKRIVSLRVLEVKSSGTGDKKVFDLNSVYTRLLKAKGKRIYFCNTVDRIQQTYDKLVSEGFDQERIFVLHNRMPRTMRDDVEKRVIVDFGKESRPDQELILLTNQVAEAGLDISASLVISDPAPVDALIQRAGRCARWFDNEGTVTGDFYVIQPPKQQIKELASPYDLKHVQAALENMPGSGIGLNWKIETEWINNAWGGGPKDAKEHLDTILSDQTFALNLFDRAAQKRHPGEIARVFREILSVGVMIEDDSLDISTIHEELINGRLDTCDISLGYAWNKLIELRKDGYSPKVIRFSGDEPEEAYDIKPGDLLILPSTVAYLHEKKGLCFGLNPDKGSTKSNQWLKKSTKTEKDKSFYSQYQSLFDHCKGVAEKTYEKLSSEGSYQEALIKILKLFEQRPEVLEKFTEVIAQIGALAAAFHDIGKADVFWQNKIRGSYSYPEDELIARTESVKVRVGIPHTPPAYAAICKAGELLLGTEGISRPIIKAVALAAVRHHTSFINPSRQKQTFVPHHATVDFIQKILRELKVPEAVVQRAEEIIASAQKIPQSEDIPLLLPNNDFYPLYALVGRAILISDRENASNKDLEQWRLPNVQSN